MWPEDALSRIGDPSTTPDDYFLAVRTLAGELVARAAENNLFPLAGIHVVSAAVDFEMILSPVVEELQARGHEAARTCLWPNYDLVLDGIIDIAPVTMAMSENTSGAMTQLLFVCQSVATITELESMAAHVLFDMGEQHYKTIVVLTQVAHIDAEQQFRMALPKEYRNAVKWIELRKDRKLTPNGVLMPGVGMSNLERAGFDTVEEVRSFVPEIFRRRYNYEKRQKPARGLGLI